MDDMNAFKPGEPGTPAPEDIESMLSSARNYIAEERNNSEQMVATQWQKQGD